MVYSIAEVLQYSFKKVFEHLGTFIMAFLMIIGTVVMGISLIVLGAALGMILGPIVGQIISSGIVLIAGITFFLGMFWYYGMIKAGYIRIALAIYDTNSSFGRLLFSEREIAWRMIIAWVLYRLIVGIGYLLFIIPGIYLEAKFAFVPYVLVDQKTGIIEAFRRSSSYSKNIIFDLAILTLIFYCFALLSCLTLGISLFITYPASLIAFAYLYRSQIERHEVHYYHK